MVKLKYMFWGFFFISFLCSALTVSADSGWDSDYSSGSSWGGSSSWDGGSSWSGSSSWDGGSYSNRDYSSYGSHHSSNSADDALFMMVLLFILIFVPIFLIIKTLILSIPPVAEDHVKIKKAVVALEDSKFNHDYDDTVRKYFPDYTEKSLIEHLFQIFIDIQVAWMNFDYDTLKKLCTDELYQSYKMDLEQLQSKHRKNIMDNISLNAANIMGITEENGTVIIKLFLHAVFNDYVMDVDNNSVVRGNIHTVLHNQYNLEFIVTKNLLEKCPNCGKGLNGKNDCEYCHSHINNNYSNFVLSKKDKI